MILFNFVLSWNLCRDKVKLIPLKSRACSASPLLQCHAISHSAFASSDKISSFASTGVRERLASVDPGRVSIIYAFVHLQTCPCTERVDSLTFMRISWITRIFPRRRSAERRWRSNLHSYSSAGAVLSVQGAAAHQIGVSFPGRAWPEDVAQLLPFTVFGYFRPIMSRFWLLVELQMHS